MSLKKCEKCGEDVEIAKAFCPECGNPFVKEEKRAGATEFDSYAGTLAFSKSEHEMLLAKMELDTSKSPEAEQPKNPVRDLPKDPPPQTKPPDKKKDSGINKWIIFAAAGAVVFIFFAAVILIALYIYFY